MDSLNHGFLEWKRQPLTGWCSWFAEEGIACLVCYKKHERKVDVPRHSFAIVPMIAPSASLIMAEGAADSGRFPATLAKPFEHDKLASEIERLRLAPNTGA